jgi:2-methylcitrate dehydratase PrpD
VEAAFQLHAQVGERLDTPEKIAQIDRIVITTHESALRIIDKKGPLHNPADRDHCIQYMAAVGLLKGNLSAADYEDAAAADPRIDALRNKMECVENSQYTRDYLDPEKRSIANALQIFFKDGTQSENIAVEYPIGHRRRRAEGIPELVKKFRVNLARRFPAKQSHAVLGLCMDAKRLEATPVNEFMDMLTI